MENINDKLLVAKSELDVLILAVKEGWWSDEEVIEKLRGTTSTIENVMKENIILKHQLSMLAKKLI